MGADEENAESTPGRGRETLTSPAPEAERRLEELRARILPGIGSLRDLVLSLEARGEETALQVFAEDGSEEISYAELFARSRRIAERLSALGLAPDRKIGLLAANGADWIVCRLALILCDVTCVPVDTDSSAESLAAILENSAAPRLLVTSDYRELAEAAIERLDGAVELWAIDGCGGGSPDSLPEPKGDGKAGVDAPEVDPGAAASQFYTSGTTGVPKAVPLTHDNLLGNVAVMLDLGILAEEDRVLLPLPLHHSFPFLVGLLMPLAVGARVILPSGLSGPALLAAMQGGGATALVGVPRLYEALVESIDKRIAGSPAGLRHVLGGLLKLSLFLRRRFGWRVGRTLLRPLHKRLAPDLRFLASGGAKLDAGVAWRLEGLGWQVFEGYGLVETTSVATFNAPGHTRLGTAGRPSPGVEMRLQEVEGFDYGEVQFRGPLVFSGYLGNPEANAASFTEDGWFRSGDLGWRDGEGFLHIAGRLKETIVLPDGKNIAPDEVEAAYGRNPLIKEVAVFERAGKLAALVVPDLEEARRNGVANPRDAIRVAFGEAGRGLPQYKRVSEFELTREEIPRTRLGKYRRHLLGEVYERARAGTGQAGGELTEEDEARLAEDDLARQVFELLRRRVPDARVGFDSQLQMDLGIDSLAWVNLSLELEERFGISLPEETVAELHSVRDLLDAVAKAERRPGGGARRPAPALAEERWIKPRRGAAVAAGTVLYGLVRGLCALLFRTRLSGGRNLPIQGPAILAPNHVSDLDPVVFGAALPYKVVRQAWWGADAGRVFGSRIGRAFARMLNLFPVDDHAPRASLETAIRVLERGGILIWFPEEWRSPDGRLQPFRPGIGMLIARTKAPVTPVVIDGTFEAMPRNARLLKPHKVEVRVGETVAAEVLLEGLDEGDGAERFGAVAERLRTAFEEIESAPERSED